MIDILEIIDQQFIKFCPRKSKWEKYLSKGLILDDHLTERRSCTSQHLRQRKNSKQIDKTITDTWRGHDTTNTTYNKCTETHLYTSRNVIILQSLDTLIKQWFSSGNDTVSRACDCRAKCPKFKPWSLPPLFAQKLELCTSCGCELIRKKRTQKPLI